MIDKIKSFVATIAILAAVVWVFTLLLSPSDAYRACERYLIRNSMALEGVTVINKLWGRKQGANLIAGVVVQPYNLEMEPITYVCYFRSGSHVVREYQMFLGDKSEVFYRSSVNSILNLY